MFEITEGMPKDFEEAPLSTSPFVAKIIPEKLFRKRNADGLWIHAFRISREQCNRTRFAHGGFLCTFADHLMASWILDTAGDGGVFSTKLEAKFINAARRGQWIFLVPEALPSSLGSNKFKAIGSVKNTTGEAYSTFMVEYDHFPQG